MIASPHVTIGPQFCLFLTTFVFLATGATLGQPIIAGEDIVNASEELRDILYERYELQQELKHLERERESLQSRLEHMDELVRQQKELDAIRHKIEQAEEDDNEQALVQLEQAAGKIEHAIELRRELQGLSNRISEANEILQRLREEDDGDEISRALAARIEKDVAAMRQLGELLEKLSILPSEEAREAEIDAIESKIDAIHEQLEDHEDMVDLCFELFEALEDENEDLIEALIREVEDVLDIPSDPNRKEKTKPAVIDTTHLPIPVTDETLAAYAESNFDQTVAPLLKTHCIECHGEESSSGELNIERMLAERPLVLNRKKWINIIEQTKNRVMPPEDATPPSERDRTAIVLATHHAIYNFDYSTVRDPGFESARRLTHAEYDNTIRDLFGTELKVAQRFPSDLAGTSGFDNSGNTLFIRPLLLERYMGAADHVVATLLPDGPPQSSIQQEAHARIFFATPESPSDDRRVAVQLLKRFITRAYRRPLSQSETATIVTSYDAARKKGLDHKAAIKGIIQSTLISPHFLLKAESRPTSAGDHRVSDWELATRLSYFIWASMPDDELFLLAADGSLHDPNVLSDQIDRLIDDPRSETLGSLFAAQWLGSQHLGTRMRLDPIDNPWCTDSLMEAMRNETAMFFHSLVRENQPIERLINADYTFLNDELAKLYKISGVTGDSMQRVKLDSDQRGGILGQGSLLAVTSFPYRTSPVVRGKWILETVLGTPPPPPPPNVSEFSDDIAEKDRLTIKQKLELHRKAPNCYACHSQMDPLGLSLENYDWFGRWRSRYGRKKIDSAGSLPNGTEFSGLTGLRNVIIEQRSDDLVRQAVTKMLSYALGRQLEYYDEPALREIITKVGEDGNRFRSLIHHVATSYPFLYKKNRTESTGQINPTEN